MRMVKPGITEGNDMSVESGLAPRELVVVDGADKLQPGTKVELRTTVGVEHARPCLRRGDSPGQGRACSTPTSPYARVAKLHSLSVIEQAALSVQPARSQPTV